MCGNGLLAYADVHVHFCEWCPTAMQILPSTFYDDVAAKSFVTWQNSKSETTIWCKKMSLRRVTLLAKCFIVSELASKSCKLYMLTGFSSKISFSLSCIELLVHSPKMFWCRIQVTVNPLPWTHQHIHEQMTAAQRRCLEFFVFSMDVQLKPHRDVWCMFIKIHMFIYGFEQTSNTSTVISSYVKFPCK